jgi:hypothetical protein
MATSYNNKMQKSFKEYTRIFDSSIDVILLSESITQVPNADAVVNCTGKHFEHHSNYKKYF